RGARRGGIARLAQELVTPEHAHIAQLAEAPGLELLLALMVVDVRMVAVDVGHRQRGAPRGREAPVDDAYEVAVARLDLVVVARDLAHADAISAAARLVQVDRFVAQVEARARLGPRAL